ncbi:MAG: TonB family protein [Bacteroidota bacterium]|nr:TonB family protein [Bacteroidota bacterium]
MNLNFYRNLHSGLDDIVFEKRNKSYGAFQLRRLYGRHMSRAIIYASLMFIIIIAYPLYQSLILNLFSDSDSEEFVMHEVQLSEPPVLIQQGDHQKASVKIAEPSSDDIQSPNIIKDKVETKSSVKPNKEPQDKPTKSKKNSDQIVEKASTNSKTDSNHTTGEKSGSESTDSSGSNAVFRFVSEMPLFPGCESDYETYSERKKCADRRLQNFLNSNIRYPAQAIQNRTEGAVYIQFIVEKNGQISNVKISKDIGDGCGAEAKRVIELMNSLPQKWKAGHQADRAVRVQYTLPVIFQGR